VRRGGGTARIGRLEEGDKADGQGPHGSDMREREGVIAEMHKLEGKMPFGEYAKAAQAEWGECEHGGLLGEAS
jgi:hypothetical protein